MPSQQRIVTKCISTMVQRPTGEGIHVTEQKRTTLRPVLVSERDRALLQPPSQAARRGLRAVVKSPRSAEGF